MLNISFDFDETTRKISNFKVVDFEKPSTIEKEIISDFDLQVLDNKIQLSSEAINKLQAEIGDRIAINYWHKGVSDDYPIISKSEIFTDGLDGNSLRKSKTFSFRGEQREWLLRYGSNFVFEEWKDKTGKVKEGVFKLIPVKEDDTSSEVKEIEHLEKEIETITPENIEDDLSFLFDD